MSEEVFLSIDVEADGPGPGTNSMLSFGVALIDPGLPASSRVVGTFTRNLVVLPDAVENEETMAWWATQPRAAWEETRRSPVSPIGAMASFEGWFGEVQQQHSGRKIVPLGWPASFDWGYMNYYLHRFRGQNVMGYQCCDVRSYFMGMLARPYSGQMDSIIESKKPERGDLRDHVALDDAIHQGLWFASVYQWARREVYEQITPGASDEG